MKNVKAGEWKLRDLMKETPFFVAYQADDYLGIEEVISFYLESNSLSPGCYETASDAFSSKVKKLIEIERNNCPKLGVVDFFHYGIRNFISDESKRFIVNLYSEYKEVKQRIKELTNRTVDLSVENYNALPDSIIVGSIPDFLLPVYVLESKKLLSTGVLELTQRKVLSVVSKIKANSIQSSLYLDVQLNDSDMSFSIGPENTQDHYFSKRKSSDEEFIAFQTKEKALNYAQSLGLPVKEIVHVERF